MLVLSHCLTVLRARGLSASQRQLSLLSPLWCFQTSSDIPSPPFASYQCAHALPSIREWLLRPTHRLCGRPRQKCKVTEYCSTCHSASAITGVLLWNLTSLSLPPSRAVDYCAATANLRGANYNIEPADRLAVKTAAGRIIPALATTTAMVTGLVLNQLCLLVQGCDDISKYSNGSVNIGNHVWGFSEPLPPRRIENSTEWRIQTMQYRKEEAAYKAAGDNSFKWRIRAVPKGFYRRDYIEFRGPRARTHPHASAAFPPFLSPLRFQPGNRVTKRKTTASPR